MSTRADVNEVLEGLVSSLKDAVRYIEVSTAYQGAMTAAEVERRIVENRSVSEVQIGANSVTTLARFNFEKARRLIKQAEKP